MINLDMDGVLVDLMGGVNYSFYGGHMPTQTEYGLSDFANTRLSVASPHWWANLSPEPFATELVSVLLTAYTPSQIRILTKYVSPMAAAGKIVWMKSNFPYLSEQITLVSHEKSFACRRGDILIDDYDNNISAWNAVGGFGITVPQPWNKARGLPVLQTVIGALDDHRDTEHG